MRVLVAEDNPVFQSMLRGMLAKWGYEAVIARDGIEAWHILESGESPRMAILDWVMPGIDGVELCHRIRGGQREPYIYVLLLSARTEVRELVEAMEAGADDYLSKPFNAHELRVRLRAGRRILDLQEELLRARESLLQQATHDGLTGVKNRVAILDLLEREAERAGREGRPIAVVMADLDHFKSINDTYGHAGGDAVLREVLADLESNISIASFACDDPSLRAVQEGRRRLLASIACKGAIKANSWLSPEEQTKLLDQLQATATPNVCPHGAPIMMTVSQYELDRKFLR
jgi:PleD family two-component response regulator